VSTLDLSSAKARLGIAATLAAAALALVLALGAAAPAAQASSCPSFQILHNDRIGPASLPAGGYTITLSPNSEVNCYSASQLLARFLEDYDGILPKPWSVVAQGSGKAAFAQSGKTSFSIARGGGGESGGNPSLGTLCPGTFTVNNAGRVGPLSFAKGQYLLYLPALTEITCRRASVLFTRFLGTPGGKLPSPWLVKSQIATFYKPAHPSRSAFRVEPLAGSGPA
jgi:hypothetical protein